MSPKKQYDKYEKFRVFDIFDHEFDKTTKLGNVFWNIMDPPEKSRLRSDDRTSLNLDEQVFAGPIIVKIQVEDNSVNNTWAVPMMMMMNSFARCSSL